MTLREAAVREWVLLSPEARLALRRYVLHYVIGCFALARCSAGSALALRQVHLCPTKQRYCLHEVQAKFERQKDASPRY